MKNLKLVNLESILDKSVLNLTISINENNARITYNPLPTIMANPSLITQLFQNLLGNAIKLRTEDKAPEIHVEAEDNGDEWIFKIIDNGIGIDSQHKDLIFEVFQRLSL